MELSGYSARADWIIDGASRGDTSSTACKRWGAGTVMLAADDLSTLRELLTPPAGASSLDAAVATTFSLDLVSLCLVVAAMALASASHRRRSMTARWRRWSCWN